ncbi:MAG: hypothetical protein HY721_17345 [Planctomycetes bacterium]|nr:hypothetical protein [Planctomycetota bacterium]
MNDPRVLRWISLALLCGSMGCSSHTIRAGIWKLTYTDVHKALTHEPLPMPSHHAAVRLAWVKDPEEPRHIEDVELVSVAMSSPYGHKPPEAPIYGEIWQSGQGPPTILIRCREADWNLRLEGHVRSPESVAGTRLEARMRGAQADQGTFEGTWRMEWLREE